MKNQYKNIPFKIDNLSAIERLDVSQMKKLLNIPEDYVDVMKSKDEISDFINMIEFKDFTGLAGEFPCVLVDGYNGKIYWRTSTKNVYVSSNGYMAIEYNLTEFVAELAKCSQQEARDFIESVYGIKLRSSK